MTATDVERQDRQDRRANLFVANFAAFALPGFVALVFLAFHLPYLPQSLEDVDSINFALGVREFDVAEHQPHPPGYPLFILAARLVHAVIPAEAKALSLVSIVSATLGVLAIGALFRRLNEWEGLKPVPSITTTYTTTNVAGDGLQAVPRASSAMWTIAATALAVTCPLYWFTAARPLSDLTGLAAAIAIQALILSARTARALVVAAFLAALAAGIRSQVVWLTVPLLVAAVMRRAGPLGPAAPGPKGPGSRTVASAAPGPKGPGPRTVASAAPGPKGPGLRTIASAAAAYAFGILLWFVPLVVLTGGPAAYWRALFSQGAEDLTGVRMVWTTPDVRTLVQALYYALVAPWAVWPLAAIILMLTAIGAVALLLRNRTALVALAVAFGPYFVFDILFQEAVTSRYALPLVVPMALLAATGARLLPRDSGLVVTALVAMYGAHIGGTSVAAYASQKAPAFRLLDDMRAARAPTPPVLAMDRREEFDLRRPMRWAGDAMPSIAAKLPSPPQHEWLELVKYWIGGGRAPVWFLADPLRTDIALVEHQRGTRGPVKYRWSVPYPVLLSGVRPNEMDWHRLARPEWYVGQGWALTPESAGVSDNDRRGPSNGPIEGWIARETLGGALVVGGRNFEASPRSIALTLDGTALAEWPVAPGFFVRIVPLPPRQTADYSRLTVQSLPAGRVAIEQFDASASRPIFGYGAGWHEPEYDPQTGRRWRWVSEKGDLIVRSPVSAVKLHVEGESPRRYFSRDSTLVIRAGGQRVFSQPLSGDFSLDVPIAEVTDTISLETDQVFMPADRGWLRRSGDRRHLGLRIFVCELR